MIGSTPNTRGPLGRAWLAWLMVASLCSLVRPALADARGTGFEAGVRVGYGIAFGSTTRTGSDALNQTIAGQVPIWIDLGYRLLPELFVGLYGHYGLGLVGDELDALCRDLKRPMQFVDPNFVSSTAGSCSTSDLSLGAQLHYHPLAKQPIDPWLGAGFGYEWMWFSAAGQGGSTSVTFHGFELFNLQAGLDLELSKRVHLGPVLAFSLGQYSRSSRACGRGLSCQPSGEVSNPALHEWLVLGIRGIYSP